jgi:hypothetical protein
MKNTPNISANAANGNSSNGNSLPIQPLGKLLDEAKNPGNGSAVKQPTTYPASKVEPAVTPQAEQPKATPPAPEPVAPAPVLQVQTQQPAATPQPEAVKRSRQEEIAFHVEKSRQLQLLNTQLISLNGKLDELKKFSYTVDQEDDHRYAKFSIFDDGNREFNCKHHGLTAKIIDFLKREFADKIDEKENELLLVSQS